jgi:hypothetical protein
MRKTYTALILEVSGVGFQDKEARSREARMPGSLNARRLGSLA